MLRPYQTSENKKMVATQHMIASIMTLAANTRVPKMACIKTPFNYQK
jgi:hypothetical protein